MARYFLQFLIAAVAACGTMQAQEPVYARVINIDSCAGILTLDNVQGFRDGDTVMIHQSHGALVDEYGNVVEYRSAGQWEIAVIDRVAGVLAFLTERLAKQYDCFNAVQICRAIAGQRVDVTSHLSAKPFIDGQGGILFMLADTLNLLDTIDANGMGYIGGERSISGWDTSYADGNAFFFDGTSGGKGQTIVRPYPERTAGKLHSAHAGGGGNARNAGGGGGAGGGQGGKGGFQTSEYDVLDVGGMGGIPILEPSSVQRLFFGGGGGGGQQNDFGASGGGAGGGIIFIRARVLMGDSIGAIIADGENALYAFDDGAGGGGGGGTIVLCFDTIIGSFAVTARGGIGGQTVSSFRCYGPGGGGGGGAVILCTNNAYRNYSYDELNVDVDGGRNGQTISPDSLCSVDSSYGASPGADGQVLKLPLPQSAGIQECGEPAIVVRTLDARARAGERFEAILEVDVRTALSRMVTLATRIRTRASVLIPEGPYRWAGRRAMIRYHSFDIPAGPPALYRIPLKYIAALGDSASVVINLDSATCPFDSLRVVIESSGTFVLDGVCTDNNRTRLFDPFSSNTDSRNEVVRYYDVLGNEYPDVGSGVILNGRYPVFTSRRVRND
ncbi:MAG: hypothetical protein HYX66_02350 [Ignavibacteria bacterium]|nr:hypothetical protein [Ignavibacteria bacterium]